MWTWLLNLFTGGLLTRLLGYLEARFNAASDVEKTRMIEETRAAIARREAARDVTIAGMGHPMWWFAFGLFVLPFGAYTAIGYYAAILGQPSGMTPLTPDQVELGRTMVQFIFGAAALSGAAGGVAAAIRGRP